MKSDVKKKRHRVSKGNMSVTIYRWTHPGTGARRWRFGWQNAGQWRYKTCQTLEGAEAEAEKVIDDMAAGCLVMASLPSARQRWLAAVHEAARGDDEAAVLDFLRARHGSAMAAEVAARYIAHKTAEEGERTRHLVHVEREIAAMGEHFKGRHMSDIGADELAAWWTERTAGKARKTAKDTRGHMVALWRWAAEAGYVSAGPSPADKLPRYRLETGERRILTPAELRAVMDAIRPEFRAWAVLGAFAGMRPDEIAPPQKAGMSRARKRGLRCEEIDWEFRCIRVAAEVSKVGNHRIVPLTDACAAGLQWAGVTAGMSGPVCARNPAECGETKRIGAAVFGGQWPKDSLRHSFGSYRNAVLRNLPQVAEEMGTSVAMLHRHYHNPQPAEIGAQWFAFRFVPIETVSLAGISAC